MPVRRVHERILASRSETEASQGMLTLARRPRFDEAQIYRGVPLVLVMAGVQDPGNLGGLLRTAEAAGATGAYLAKGTADPYSWKALRGSMGSAFRLPLMAGLKAEDVLARVRARGLEILAAVKGRPALRPCRHAQAGRDPPWQRRCRPSRGPARGRRPAGHDPDARPGRELERGVAAGILLFEAARQRG